jgi:hypothetical protein
VRAPFDLLTRLPARRRCLIVVALVFFVSRLVYRIGLGVRFDTVPVTYFIQFVDPWFLRHDFLRSILYLHHQAPLENVLVGIPLHFLRDAPAFAVIDFIYVAIGLATALGLVEAMLGMGAGPVWAALVSSLYTISPTTVTYENWLLYHPPVACALVWALVALLRFHRMPSFGSASAFFLALTTAALLRSTINVTYVAAMVGLLLLWPPFHPSGRAAIRKVILRAAAGPLLLVALVAVKPTLLLGYGYGEALLWGNLSKKIWNELPEAERTRLLTKDLVSPAAEKFCLTDLRDFEPFRIPHEPLGVPLMDMERAPNGRWNAHAFEYLPLARELYKADALYLLRHYPGAYARGVGHALAWYLSPATNDANLPASPNYRRLTSWREALDELGGARDGKSSPALAVGIPLLLLFGAVSLGRARRDVVSERRTAIGLAYILATILYAGVSTMLISYGDFSRYRFEIDPLYLVLLATALTRGQALLWTAAARLGKPIPVPA